MKAISERFIEFEGNHNEFLKASYLEIKKGNQNFFLTYFRPYSNKMKVECMKIPDAIISNHYLPAKTIKMLSQCIN